MVKIKDAHIIGEHKDVTGVIENFGEIYFSYGFTELSNRHISLSVKRLDNVYQTLKPGVPLYILVPNSEVKLVRPDPTKRYVDIRYGAAGRGPGIALHLPSKIGLFFCLTPNGSSIKQVGDLGII